MNFFITGTDTGVGKTHVTAALVRALRRMGHDTIGLKPICCGDREDVAALQCAAAQSLSADEINPIWLTAPAAPLVAARQDGREIDLTILETWFDRIRKRHASILVEGAGGWLVPITPSATVADLAALYKLPVIVVVANKLGCLNHTLLTVANIEARGLFCAGLILNHCTAESSIAAETNRNILEETCPAPILLEVAHGQKEIDLSATAAPLGQ